MSCYCNSCLFQFFSEFFQLGCQSSWMHPLVAGLCIWSVYTYTFRDRNYVNESKHLIHFHAVKDGWKSNKDKHLRGNFFLFSPPFPHQLFNLVCLPSSPSILPLPLRSTADEKQLRNVKTLIRRLLLSNEVSARGGGELRVLIISL